VHLCSFLDYQIKKEHFMNSKKLTTTAILIALGTVLSAIPAFSLPFGGSITYASMVPIVIISLMYGSGWGLASGGAFGIIQYFLGASSLESLAANMPIYLFALFIDYILAFAVLGLAALFVNKKLPTAISIALAGFAAAALRFVCHIISGIAIWGEYAEKFSFWGMHASGESVAWYSFVYNATYMFPEIIITAVVLFILGSLPQMKGMLSRQ
jgi:thiamine transporter